MLTAKRHDRGLARTAETCSAVDTASVGSESGVVVQIGWVLQPASSVAAFAFWTAREESWQEPDGGRDVAPESF